MESTGEEKSKHQSQNKPKDAVRNKNNFYAFFMTYKLKPFFPGGAIPTARGGSKEATAGVAQEAGGGSKTSGNDETKSDRRGEATLATARTAQEKADRARFIETTGDAEKEKGRGGQKKARRTVEAAGSAEAARGTEAPGGASQTAGAS